MNTTTATAFNREAFYARAAAMADTMRELSRGDIIRVTTHGSKRSITRTGEVREVRDHGGSLVYIVCWQKRYEGKPWEAVHRFIVTASAADAIEVVR